MSRVLVAIASILFVLTAAVSAQEPYPSRPITIVVPVPPGGIADLTARPLAPALERVLKQPVVITNKAGAAGAVGMQSVAVAKPDGYTMYLSAGSATAAQMHLFKVPPVNVLKAFQLAATINR